jgi:hypothetical protein
MRDWGWPGITPVMGILRDVYRDTLLSSPSTAYRVRHVHVIWSVQQVAHYGWFATEMNAALAAAAAAGGQDGRHPLPTLTVHVHCSKQAEGAANPFADCATLQQPRASLQFARGRPQLPAALASATATLGDSGGRVYVLACGPPAMVRETWDAATALRATHNYDVYFHRETFEL